MAKTAYDLIVVGAGVMGAATADFASGVGAKTLLMEQFADAGHKYGSSHGDGRIFRFAYEEDIYIALMRSALVGWRGLQQETEERIMATTGGMDIGPKEGRAEALSQIYTRHKLPYELISAAQMSVRFPQFALSTGQIGVFQPDAGVLFATKAVGALCARAKVRGCDVVRGLPAVRIERDKGDAKLLHVHTSNGGVYSGRNVAFCGGSWMSGFMKQHGLNLPTKITMETVSYFAPKKGCSIDHTYSNMPVFLPFTLDNGLGKYGYYGLPQIDRLGVKASAHYCGPELSDPSLETRPDQSHPRVQAVIQSTQQLVKQLLPHLETTPAHTESCLYTSTPDLDFVIGAHPSMEGVYVAGGGSGHAFKFGTAIGEILARMALGLPDIDLGQSCNHHWREKFSPARFGQINRKETSTCFK